jgi:methionine-rich copper-binding protein CopC
MPGTTSPAPRLSTGRLLATLGAVLLGALTGAAGAAAPASAHTALRSSSPAEGAVLTTSPGEVRLAFTERPASAPVEVAVTRDGRVVGSGPARTDGSSVVTPVSLPGPGAYTVAYRVVGGDGHPVQGTVRFRVAALAESTATPSPSPSPTEIPNLAPRASASPTALVPPPPDTSRWPHVVIAVVLLILVGIAIVLLTGKRPPKRPRF